MLNLSYEGRPISCNEEGYVNLGQLCATQGCKFQDWTRLKSSNDYLYALADITGIPVFELIHTKRGNSGSWGHPLVAIEVARWISAKFGVWCNIHIGNLVQSSEIPVIKDFLKQDPVMKNPVMKNPVMENPVMKNPVMENPVMENQSQETLLPHPRRKKAIEEIEVSPQMIRAWVVLLDASEWLTSKEVALKAGIAPRTASMYTKYFTDLGLLERLQVFPAFRFKMYNDAYSRNTPAYSRLEEVRTILSNKFSITK